MRSRRTVQGALLSAIALVSRWLLLLLRVDVGVPSFVEGVQTPEDAGRAGLAAGKETEEASPDVRWPHRRSRRGSREAEGREGSGREEGSDDAVHLVRIYVFGLWRGAASMDMGTREAPVERSHLNSLPTLPCRVA